VKDPTGQSSREWLEVLSVGVVSLGLASVPAA
jgi:hypothetical protein